MTDRLNGKRIFLTGAAQGIGLAIAKECLNEGARLFLVDRDATLLAEAASGLNAGDRVAYATADISDRAAIEAAVAAADDRIGPINALINNAGINVFARPLESTDEEWNRCFDVNLKGAWNCCRAVLPGMIAGGGGAIVNIASTHSFTIIPHTFPYPLAKHALVGLTKSLALEYAGQGVRVNAIAPGYVETPINRDFFATEGGRALVKRIPQRRLGRVEDLEAPLILLASDASTYMTGANLVVDGGWTAW